MTVGFQSLGLGVVHRFYAKPKSEWNRNARTWNLDPVVCSARGSPVGPVFGTLVLSSFHPPNEGNPLVFDMFSGQFKTTSPTSPRNNDLASEITRHHRWNRPEVFFPAVAAHTKAGKIGALLLNALKISFSYFDKLGSFCLSSLCRLKPIFPAVAAHTKAGKIGTLLLNALKRT